MNHKVSLIIGVLAVLSLLGQASANDETPRTIRVTGEGTSSAAPDMATIQTGVVSQAKSAVDAMNKNNETMQKLMADLKELKVAERDMQTSQFNVNPEYERGPRGEHKLEIIGYRVTNQLKIRVRDLPELGKMLDSLIRSGSNQISGISLGVDDSTAVMNEARIKAIEDARARAELYAKAAGVAVGKVISIDEQRAVMPPPVFYGRAMEASAMSVPIATGEQDYSATINVTFELVDNESADE